MIDAAANTTFSTALTALKAKASELNANPVTQVKNADGTTTWQIVNVGGLVGPSDIQQFTPAGLDIKAGDTVEWESSVPTPHTVTFLGGEDPDKLFADVQDPLASPVVFLPTAPPASGYNGVGYINSGVIGDGWPSGQTFSVKFTDAGAFPFACILHVDQGMGGVINVTARTQTPATPTASPTATPTKTATPVATGTAPTPPKTGNAGLLDGGEAQYLALMLIGFGATMLVGLRVATGRWR